MGGSREPFGHLRRFRLSRLQKTICKAREAAEKYLDSPRGTKASKKGFCAMRGPLKAILCYEKAFKGNPALREGWAPPPRKMVSRYGHHLQGK